MRWTLILSLFLGIMAGFPHNIQASSASSVRTRDIFNANWRFQRGDFPDARKTDFDDSAWQRIGLPHSFGIPYFQESSFYVGYGWYRKNLHIPQNWQGRRVFLEFEGAFQDAEVFVNALQVGRHRGGYTGFSLDITEAITPGDNTVAVRLNNLWDATLAPRAGEHVFQGGLYRDVWLVTTSPIHIPWYGTRLTTPELSEKSGKVVAEIEIRNTTSVSSDVLVTTSIIDPTGRTVATLKETAAQLPAGKNTTITQSSAQIPSPMLWSPETPFLYKALTTLSVDDRIIDHYESDFGFRWIEWTADRGFFLNGTHRYLKGANVHQDMAGWGDAVTNSAMWRDVQMMKDAGLDFIRGAHYPHDPSFMDATDTLGMLFWSEIPFWGIGGFGPDGNWLSSAYPIDEKDKVPFEDNLRQQLSEMIRIGRNHPSVIAWSMGNETFFSAPGVMDDVRRFLSSLVDMTHQLDPTRPAAIGGVQRGEIDHIGDIAGYNGDGAWMFPDPGIANLVSEYGSTMSDRPGTYDPGWGELSKTESHETKDTPFPWRYPWRSGEAIWSGFDHGSIVGQSFGSMGIIDYARIPKRSYYWYRNIYRNIPPPPWPIPGTPAGLQLTSTPTHIVRADGTEDVFLTVSVIDAEGRALSNSPPVTLAIESGPGEFPTGRAIHFAPESTIAIRDGQAATTMRSWQAGTSLIRASSPGLKEAFIRIETLEGPPFTAEPQQSPSHHPVEVSSKAPQSASQATEGFFGLYNPTGASSSETDHPPPLANDGTLSTYWAATSDDPTPWISIDPEKILQYQKLDITFPQPGNYRFIAQILDQEGSWLDIVDASQTPDTSQHRILATRQLIGSRLRITLFPPENAIPGIAEITIIGTMKQEKK